MKKLISTIALAGLSFGSVNAQAPLGDLSISGSFDFETQYVFRGKQYAWQSIQPGVEFGYPVLGGEAYTGIWSNQQISNKGMGGVPFPPGSVGRASTDEVDFYFGYAYPVTDMFTVDAGFTYYWFSNANGFPAAGGPSRQYREIYVGATADVIMSPALYVYYDFDQGQTVVEGSVGYSFDLGEYAGVTGLSIDLGAHYGWLRATRTYGITGIGSTNGYMYGGANADLVYSFNEHVSASFGVRWAANNDGKTGANAQGLAINQGSRESNIWFGASIGFAY
jgi:hypothetical protein